MGSGKPKVSTAGINLSCSTVIAPGTGNSSSPQKAIWYVQQVFRRMVEVSLLGNL
jgi:hypothetical protein